MVDYKVNHTVIRISEESQVKLHTVIDKFDRVFIEFNELIENIFATKEEQTSVKETIPACYFKSFQVNNKKMKMIDKLALSYIAKSYKNYEFYKTITNQLIGTPKEYTLQSFADSFYYLSSKISTLDNIDRAIKEKDCLQQDLLHELENKDMNKDEMLGLAEKLKEVRTERRIAKNQHYNLNLISKFLIKHTIGKDDIEKLIYDISRLDFVFKNKIYNSRLELFKEKENKKKSKKGKK